MHFHRHVASAASVFNSFLWKLNLKPCAVHCGIESGAQKGLRAAESSKTFLAFLAFPDFMQISSEKQWATTNRCEKKILKRKQGVQIVFRVIASVTQRRFDVVVKTHR